LSSFNVIAAKTGLDFGLLEAFSFQVEWLTPTFPLAAPSHYAYYLKLVVNSRKLADCLED
jgi:hypothetical protein